MHHGAGSPQRERLVEHLIVPKRLIVRVKEEVEWPSIIPGITVVPGRSIVRAPRVR